MLAPPPAFRLALRWLTQLLLAIASAMLSLEASSAQAQQVLPPKFPPEKRIYLTNTFTF